MGCAGVYVNSYDQSLNVKNGFPVFNTLIEANYVGGAKAEFILTDEDKAEIHRLARDPRIGAPPCPTSLPPFAPTLAIRVVCDKAS